MNKTISLTALVSDESSVVEAQGPTHNGVGQVTAKGWAKKHPNDQPDEQVGFNVAVARALRALADQYDKRAEECMAQPFQYTVTFTGGYTDGYLTANNLISDSKLHSVGSVR